MLLSSAHFRMDTGPSILPVKRAFGLTLPCDMEVIF